MASILELALDDKISIKDIIIWLLSKGKDESLPDVFKEHKTVQQEFIPYFLNYLRDQTLHLLQNSKLNGSPSKTPLSSQYSDTNKQSNKKVNPNSSSKRMQLFADSPSDNNKEFCSPIYSPGNESPVFRNSSERQKKYDQKFFQRGHKSPNMTPEPNRGKYKLSLGEFMSPDPGQRRKSSPFSNANKDYKENSPSPTVISERGNKSSGKKRATLHTISKTTNSFTEKSPVFNLSEKDFPPVGLHATNRDETPKPKRRINPTQLLPDAKKNAAAKFKKLAEVVEKPANSNTNGVKSDTALSSVDGDICLADERELLRKEKAKRQQSMESISSTTSTISTPSKLSLDRRTSCSSNTEYITACLDFVTHRDKLDILVQLYSSCLDEHLFPNISVELYFLIQLLTSLSEDIKSDTPSVNTDSEDVSLFLTVHNAVYFSVNVLKQQLNLLKYLDRSVIKLLAENKRLVDFSSELNSSLLELYTSFSVKKYSSFPRSPIGGVSFQADTDNRKNFPCDKLFHQFKKQRDLFYELIREWEEKRLTTGWSVQEVLGNKIRYLVNVNTDLANHLHFARLFLSQLISMCKGDGVIRTEDDDDNIALLAHLKKTNPAKFKKLQERFIQPFSAGGPCPPASFPGNQEFFKEFIVAASSPVLNQHLSNIFTAKIKKLNSTEFSQNPSEENQESESINQDQYELFASCLLTLRLLGKFLGYLTFSPYHSVNGLPDDIQSNYIELRNNQPNPIDIFDLMMVCINTERSNITIPWIIEYLSMMDRIAPVLNYYHKVLYILHYIHRLSWKTVKKEKYNFGCLMLVSMLSWLFESPIMPQGVFIMEVTDELPNIKAIDSTLCLFKPVDNLDLVDQELLYTVCPYLGEIRTLLLEFAVGANSKSTIRKITPVSADDLPEPESDRNLQTQLEENFFHNHPASMKRTVEFVSERTASNFIKHFRATDLPWSISEAKSRVNSLLQWLNSIVVSPTNKLKDQNHQFEYKKIAQNLCEEVKRKVSNTKREYCSSRVNSSLKLLLPDEQSSAVTNMAASICCRLAEDRIKSWMTNHISTAMYLKEVNAEADKLFKKKLFEQSSSRQIDIGNRLDLPVALLNTTPEASSSLTNVTTKSTLSQAVLIPVSSIEDSHNKHREDIISLSDLLHTIQVINKEMVVNKCFSLDYTRLMMIMEQTHHILLFKEDTVPQAVRSLAQLILDLAISIISYMPELVTVELLDCYQKLYETELKDVTIFSIVSSPRWFLLLHTSPNKQKCVPSYVLFICFLLTENLITTDVYEKGCIKVLNVSNVYKELIKTIFCDIIKYFNSNKQVTIKFSSDILTLLQLNNNKHDLQTELSHLAIHPST